MRRGFAGTCAPGKARMGILLNLSPILRKKSFQRCVIFWLLELKAAENQFLSSLASKQEKPDVVVWPARPGSSNTGHVIIDNDSPGDPVIFLGKDSY